LNTIYVFPSQYGFSNRNTNREFVCMLSRNKSFTKVFKFLPIVARYSFADIYFTENSKQA